MLLFFKEDRRKDVYLNIWNELFRHQVAGSGTTTPLIYFFEPETEAKY